MKNLLTIRAAVLLSLLLTTAPGRAQDTFSAEEVVVQKVSPTEPKTEARRTLRFAPDETRVIYEAPPSDNPHWSFYLPREANSVVQLIIQKHHGKRVFLLKAVGRGKTVGGFVHRDWLDDDGLEPRSPLDEAKVQQAVKSRPIYVTVE